ncbi:MAG: CIA30 family protein [Verrucomicrobia bacterium]|nr:MAG: CIA30 family protein [Verrucomicrobiota bacterium]
MFSKIHRFFTSVFLLALFAAAQSFGEESTAKAAFHLTFNDANDEPKWIAQNDGVMGGLSTGRPIIADGMLDFSGTLSLENNGGFSSIMTHEKKFDLTGMKQMILRVKGDGRTYRLRISTDAKHRGSSIVYMAEFPTQAGQWLEVSVPFSSMKPSHHGNDLSGPALDLTKIEEIGLLIGDKRAGDFSLKIDWMKAQ